MLQVIRDKVTGWVAWVIVGAIALTMGLWGMDGYFSSSASEPVAIVNDIKITRQDLEIETERLNRLYQLMSEQTGSDATPPITLLRQSALQDSISRLAISTTADKYGYRVSPQQAFQRVQADENFQVNGEFSESMYGQWLYLLLFSNAEYIQYIQKNMLARQLQAGVEASSFVLPNETTAIATYLQQTRDIEYITIPAANFTSQISIDEGELLDYYEENQQIFMRPEQISIDYIVLDDTRIANDWQVNDADIEAYYQVNSVQFTTPKRNEVAQIFISVPSAASSETFNASYQQMQDIKTALADGEDFAKMARKYSEDEETAQQGGELGWVTQDELPPILDQAINMLSPGDVSDVIITDDGLYLIKLQAQKDAVLKPLKDVREQVVSVMRQQHVQQYLASLLDDVAEMAYTNSDSLIPISDAFDLTIQHSGFFGRAGGSDEFTGNALVVNAAFSEEVREGFNSSLIELNANQFIVLRERDYRPAQVRAFDQVKTEITNALTQEKTQLLAVELGSEMLSELNSSESIDSILRQHNLKWVRHSGITRAESMELIKNATIVEAAFNAVIPADNEYINTSVLTWTGDFVIVHVGNIDYPDTSSLVALSDIQDELTVGLGASDYLHYYTNMLNNSKIKTYDVANDEFTY